MSKTRKPGNTGPDPEEVAENERLKRRLVEDFGMREYGGSFQDLKQENAWLRMVLEREEMLAGPQVRVRTLFPEGTEFLPADCLSEAEMIGQLDYIEDVLGEADIIVDLREGLPVSLKYAHVINQILDSEIPASRPPGTLTHFDGCDGGCDVCFQRKFCDTAREIEKDPES